jgi:predicted phage terminase large subunit-like protein
MIVTAASHPTIARELRRYGNRFPSVEQVERELRKRSLAHFIRDHWSSVDPAPYKHGKHIDCICEHLEAVSRSEIRRLVINVPPGHMKSITVSVMWPAWDWMTHPEHQWLFASYAQTLSNRDSMKCNTVIKDPLYQQDMAELHEAFGLTQDTQVKFSNTYNGYRIAASSEGMLTGEGARDYLVIDDPHNVVQGESEKIREGVVRWFRTSFLTRARDPEVTRIVIIMQRVHERDVAGVALSEELGFEHLCLPARYEGHDRINTSLVNWGDWRTEDKEPLWPEHYSEQSLKELEKGMGAYAVAGQLQQRPAPREGGIYNVTKLTIIDIIDRRKVKRAVRYWDKAATAGGGCDTAGVLMCELDDGRVFIDDVTYGQWGSDEREARMKETAAQDMRTFPPRGALQVMEQEPGSGGKDSAVWGARNLRGFRVRVDKVTGSKEDRAEPFSGQVNVGNVMLRRAAWNDKLKTQLEMFPNASGKDIADACSGAFNHLFVRALKRVGVFGGKRDKEGLRQSSVPAIAVPGQSVKTVCMKLVSL